MKNPFGAQAKAERVVAKATSLVERRDAQVVCTHCGEGGLVRVKNGHLVKMGGVYRHSDPRACALVMRRLA